MQQFIINTIYLQIDIQVAPSQDGTTILLVAVFYRVYYRLLSLSFAPFSLPQPPHLLSFPPPTKLSKLQLFSLLQNYYYYYYCISPPPLIVSSFPVSLLFSSPPPSLLFFCLFVITLQRRKKKSKFITRVLSHNDTPTVKIIKDNS